MSVFNEATRLNTVDTGSFENSVHKLFLTIDMEEIRINQEMRKNMTIRVMTFRLTFYSQWI